MNRIYYLNKIAYLGQSRSANSWDDVTQMSEADFFKKHKDSLLHSSLVPRLITISDNGTCFFYVNQHISPENNSELTYYNAQHRCLAFIAKNSDKAKITSDFKQLEKIIRNGKFDYIASREGDNYKIPYEEFLSL
jgi:hypothetical protein